MTPKQQRFVEEYLIDLNATQAAIRAGYAEKTAYSQGQRLLKDVEIAHAVDEAKLKRSAETGIDAAWVLKRLADEVEADISDLYNPEGNLRPIHDWPVIWRKGLVAGIDTVRGAGDDPDVIDKIKLSDRVKRLEMIGKHVSVQAFKDNVQVDTGPDLKAIYERLHGGS